MKIDETIADRIGKKNKSNPKLSAIYNDEPPSLARAFYGDVNKSEKLEAIEDARRDGLFNGVSFLSK